MQYALIQYAVIQYAVIQYALIQYAVIQYAVIQYAVITVCTNTICTNTKWLWLWLYLGYPMQYSLIGKYSYCMGGRAISAVAIKSSTSDLRIQCQFISYL